MEAARVSVRDLSRNTAEVMGRIEAGEKIEVTRNGITIAVISPPDVVGVMTQGLIKAGILESDWQERQGRTLRRLRSKRRPAPPDGVLGSQTIVEMREEERF